MLNDKLKKLAAEKARLAKLEQSLEAERLRRLAGLPAEYGFDNLKDFIAALKRAAKGGRGRSRAAAAKSGKRKARVAITDAIRAKVKALVAAGKTGNEIAATVGVSVPSVHNIKKALGLVKARG
jgi:hypothetical protein